MAPIKSFDWDQLEYQRVLTGNQLVLIGNEVIPAGSQWGPIGVQVGPAEGSTGAVQEPIRDSSETDGT